MKRTGAFEICRVFMRKAWTEKPPPSQRQRKLVRTHLSRTDVLLVEICKCRSLYTWRCTAYEPIIKNSSRSFSEQESGAPNCGRMRLTKITCIKTTLQCILSQPARRVTDQRPNVISFMLARFSRSRTMALPRCIGLGSEAELAQTEYNG